MKTEIIRHNAIINGISLIIFCIFSYLLFSYYNFRSLEDNLSNISTILINQLNETSSSEEMYETIDKFTLKQEWFNVSVSDINGNIIKNTDSSSVDTSLTSNELRDALNESEGKIYLQDSTLNYIIKIKDNIIIRASSKYNFNATLLYINLIFMISLLIMELLISVYVSTLISKNVIETFENIGSHLKTINEGSYSEIEDKHKYVEVEGILKEINEVNKNILKSMNSIKFEHSKMNFVINNMRQGILIVSEDEKVLLINDYAKDILGIEDVVEDDINYHRIMVSKDITTNIERALERQENRLFDYVDENKEAIYSISLMFIKNKWAYGAKEIGLVIMLMSDVTENRNNEQLKSEFVSNVSHELKSPVTTISGFSELLLTTCKDQSDKTKNYLGIIHKEALKMKDTIDELLYLSNLEYRRNVDGEKEKVFFKEIVDTLIERYTSMLEKESIKVLTRIDDDLYIYESANLLNHLIENLFSNAIKYNKGNGKIFIYTEDLENKIKLVVADTGIGISEKDISRIFERFYRVDESHNRNNGSTGIGLNIVKQICDVLEATINVESKQGVGTRFTIIFNKNEEE